MTYYMKMGKVPAKRHIKLERPKAESHLGEGMYYEHVVTTEGFDRAYSIMYHLRPPTRVTKIEHVGQVALRAADPVELRTHHVKTFELPRKGDPITGRVPMFFNDDLVSYTCKPKKEQETIFRNGAADEVVFIHEGGGVLETNYGLVPYKEGDYVVIPRTTNYRFRPDNIAKESYLVIESFGSVRVPDRYRNADGQLMLGMPFYERDLHGPTQLVTIDNETETNVIVKDHDRLTRITHASHPFDVIGWDGFVYPYTFSAHDFEPLTGTVHLPPPVQQTFEARGFVICTFAPRYLDHHPQAVKVPYVHSNVEADEVLFYTRGNFASRRGVTHGSMTLHPGGIPHGPHPGTIMASMNHDRTEELAVMFDTDRKLHITPEAMGIDDAQYPYSWLDD